MGVLHITSDIRDGTIFLVLDILLTEIFFYGKLATTIFFLLGPHIFEGQVDRQVDNALHSVTVIPVASAIRFLDCYPPENRDNDLSVG